MTYVRSGQRILPSKEDIVRAMDRAKRPRDRALFSILYLTGHRIAEILLIRKMDVVVEEGFLVLNMAVLKRRESIIYRHKLYFGLSVPFVDNIIDFADSVSDGWLFKGYAGRPISTRQALNIIKSLNKRFWCHLFREYRATDLVEKHGANETELMVWFGWKHGKQAHQYVRRSSRMIKRFADKID